MSTTGTWGDAVVAIETARDRASELLGRPLIEDVTDHQPETDAVAESSGSSTRPLTGCSSARRSTSARAAPSP